MCLTHYPFLLKITTERLSETDSFFQVFSYLLLCEGSKIEKLSLGVGYPFQATVACTMEGNMYHER